MSYDFVLFRPDDGVDPRAIVDGDSFETGARDAAIEAAKRRIADALIAHDPDLSEHVFDYDEVARLYKMPVAAAYQAFRYIELTDVSAGGSGTQITLFDDRASVTVPFWHSNDADGRQLQRVWGYIDIVCRESGYEVFDMQLDRVITRAAFDDARASYARAAARVQSINAPLPRRRPWWKFW
jgi:hypothetical protein